MTAYEELFKDNKGENLNKEFEFGQPVGCEQIWSMTDEAYEKEYGDQHENGIGMEIEIK